MAQTVCKFLKVINIHADILFEEIRSKTEPIRGRAELSVATGHMASYEYGSSTNRAGSEPIRTPSPIPPFVFQVWSSALRIYPLSHSTPLAPFICFSG
jgi:hypothetical protein